MIFFGFWRHWLWLIVVLLAATGCSELNGTRLEPVLGGDVDLMAVGDEAAERLCQQSLPPLMPNQAAQPILVATPVNNDDLESTTSFGRSLQNSLVAGFVHRGYAVKEIKLRRNLLVEERHGEFMLSRNLQDLAGSQRAQAVVVTTYTVANRVLYLSVRLVAPQDQRIKAVFEQKLTLDANTLRMLGLKIKTTGDDPTQPVMPPKPSILDDILY